MRSNAYASGSMTASESSARALQRPRAGRSPRPTRTRPGERGSPTCSARRRPDRRSRRGSGVRPRRAAAVAVGLDRDEAVALRPEREDLLPLARAAHPAVEEHHRRPRALLDNLDAAPQRRPECRGRRHGRRCRRTRGVTSSPALGPSPSPEGRRSGLAHPQLVEKHSLRKAVLVVPHARGDQVDIAAAGQRDNRGLVRCGPVGLSPPRCGVRRVVALGSEGAVDICVQPVVTDWDQFALAIESGTNAQAGESVLEDLRGGGEQGAEGDRFEGGLNARP